MALEGDNMIVKPASSHLRWLAVGISISAIAAFLLIRELATGGSAQQAHATEVATSDAVSVEVISPRPGGIDRLCQQPGSVEPFEAAALYAKVSGFLVEQNVDIGYAVSVGDVLARISAPELDKQVKQDSAEVEKALARVEQMKAAIDTSEAELAAATATVAMVQAEQKSKASYRSYREKQRNRIKELADSMAVDAKLAEESEDHYQAAIAADLAAGEAIGAAKQKEAAARARLKQSHADLTYAVAEVGTAKARLEKSKVLLDYTVIRSPYTGVVTKRNFDHGGFIRSADAGGDRIPVLAVERTDIMRVVVQVPERDVPLVDCGDPAIVEVDALPGVAFKTRGADKVEVSRLAASEDPHTRMMRTEVHVKNLDGKLRRGMFGRVTLTLQTGASGALRIPSAALAGKAEGGKGSVRVLRDDRVEFLPVTYGADNGTEVEIISGLAPTDLVIVRASGPISNGSTVTATTKSSQTGRPSKDNRP
jgi:HlyD family secretion protein